ncbi:MAG: leucine-rich repeat protein, partial [Clostridia bacterium]
KFFVALIFALGIIASTAVGVYSAQQKALKAGISFEYVPFVDGDFTFANNADGQSYVVTKYNGNRTSVVVPREATKDGVTKIVTEIGESAFSGNKTITDFLISDNIKRINKFAFKDCTALNSADITNGVTELGQEPFDDCTALKDITIGSGLLVWGIYPFDMCSAIETIVVDPANPNFASVNNVLYSKNGKTLFRYPSAVAAANFQIPASVTKIEPDAFCCAKITGELNMPSALVEVGEAAFEFCTVSKIKFNSTTAPNASAKSFAFANDLTAVSVPTLSLNAYITALNGKGFAGGTKMLLNESGNEVATYNAQAGIWQKHSQTIVFNTNGGNAIANMQKGFADPVTLPLPTKAGNTFDGWFSQSDFSGSKVEWSQMPWIGGQGATITIHAKWIVESYTLDFDENGGSIVANITAPYGTALSLPAPVRTGYTFAGWFEAETSNNGSGTQFLNATMPDLGVNGTIKTLYAKWTPNPYTITFNKDGGVGGNSSVIATYGENLPKITIPQKVGHDFVGYYETFAENITPLSTRWEWLNPDHQGRISIGSVAELPLGSAVTLFMVSSCPTLTFDINDFSPSQVGASVAMILDGGKYIYAVSFKVTQAMIDFYGNAYRFVDFNISPSQTISVIGCFKNAIFYYHGSGNGIRVWDKTNDATLKAMWKISEYDITVNPNGGTWKGSTLQQTSKQKYGTFMPVGEPSRPDHTFTGWSGGAFDMISGTSLHSDPTFLNGINDARVYNNSNNGTVTIERIAAPIGTPTGSGFVLQVKTTGEASPGHGGFVRHTESKSSGIFYHSFIAKLPIGYIFEVAYNQIGINADGSKGEHKWISPWEGTGQWENYVYRINCGTTGPFSTFGHVYAGGGPVATAGEPLVWQVASSNIYDATTDKTVRNVDGFKIVASNATLTANWEHNYLAFTEINGGADYSVRAKNSSIAVNNLVIPSTYNGKPVTTIADNGFQYCANLTGTLTIPSSVTSIGSYAFHGCTGFTGNLAIPDSVITIGEYAFSWCTGLLGTLTIPNSVTSIRGAAFYNCTGLSGTLTIPSFLTSISNHVFYNCKGLTGTLAIPETITSIGDAAFQMCIGLSGTLTIPNSVTSVGAWAFDGCKGFTGTLTLGNSLITIGKNAFQNSYGFSGPLTIPNSVTSIGNDAFANCTGLRGALTISNSMTIIEKFTFWGCSGLTGVLMISNLVTSIGDCSFAHCSFKEVDMQSTVPPTLIGTTQFAAAVEVIWVPNESAVAAYKANASWQPYWNKIFSNENRVFEFQVSTRTITGLTAYGKTIVNITVPATIGGVPVDAIAGKSFAGNNTVQSVIISEGVKRIDGTTDGQAAFDCCANLVSISIPSTMTSIGFGAFWSCTKLREVVFASNSSLEIIYEAVFHRCTALETIALPASVKVIKTIAFEFCTALKEVEMLGAVPPTLEGSGHFPNETQVIWVPDETALKAYRADASWQPYYGKLNTKALFTFTKNGFKTYEIAAANKTISANNLFIPSIYLNNPVTGIADNGFQDCTNLTGALSIPSSVTSIGISAFLNCGGSTFSVNASNANYSNDGQGFLYNKNQTILLKCLIGQTGSITIPNSVITISDH